MTTLYRYFDAGGRLLYVGITGRPDGRMNAHSSTSRWWPLVASSTIQHFGSRQEAARAETAAIQAEKPLFNIAGRSDGVSDWVDALQSLPLAHQPYVGPRGSRRIGALTSWANTPDRPARTAAARKKSPGDVAYWIDKLDPERFAEATYEQRVQAAQAAKSAHFARLALASAKARKKR